MRIKDSDEILEYLDKVRRIPRQNRFPNFSDIARHSRLHIDYVKQLPMKRYRIGGTNRRLFTRAIEYFGEPRWVEQKKRATRTQAKRNIWFRQVSEELREVLEILRDIQQEVKKT